MNSNINKRVDSGRLKKRRSKSKRLLIILSAASALLFLLTLGLAVALAMCGREITDLTVLERKQAQKLAMLEPKVKEMEYEIATLVESRLPYMVPLSFDNVLPVNQAYVKNIAFTLTGKDDEKHYEYKMVMDNRGLGDVYPHVQIILFNKFGIQVGISEFGVDKDGIATSKQLSGGEIRSYVSQVNLTDNTDPKYFLVKVKTGA